MSNFNDFTQAADVADTDHVIGKAGSASGAERIILWSLVKSKLKTYFDTLYQPLASVLTNTTASFTTAQETKLSGIETSADVTDAGNVGSSIHGATGKTTPVDADTVPLIDSAASNALKKVTWLNLKATLKTYFDTIYTGGTPAGSSGDLQTNNAGAFGSLTPGSGVSTFLATPSGANLASALTTALPVTKGGTGGTTPITGADGLSARGADIASAATINLTTATGQYLDVTGTTTITAITLADGLTRATRFTGALTLTNGASLLLPGGVNITTEAGDVAFWAGYAGGVVRCIGFMPSAKTELQSRLASDVQTTVTGATDTGLTVELAANSHYALTGWARLGCTGTGGLKIGVVSPASAVHTFSGLGRSTSSSAFVQVIGIVDGLAGAVFNNAVNEFGFYQLNGFVTTTTAGTYKITFASVTNGQTSTMYAGAWILLKKN